MRHRPLAWLPLLALLVLGTLATGPVPRAEAAVHPTAVPVQASTFPAPAAVRLLQAAEDAVGGLTSTRYQHRLDIRPGAGIWNADCSLFVSYLLREHAPAAFAALDRERGRWYPRAFKFYESFAGLDTRPRDGWQPVRTVDAIEPGDVIAWASYPIVAGRNTGHVMIAASTPRALPDGTWVLEVIDASSTRHGDDTRTFPAGGVGRGTIALATDARGAPIARQIRPGVSRWGTLPIAIGRLAGG